MPTTIPHPPPQNLHPEDVVFARSLIEHGLPAAAHDRLVLNVLTAHYHPLDALDISHRIDRGGIAVPQVDAALRRLEEIGLAASMIAGTGGIYWSAVRAAPVAA